jgi:hypothetical protein
MLQLLHCLDPLSTCKCWSLLGYEQIEVMVHTRNFPFLFFLFLSFGLFFPIGKTFPVSYIK